MVLGPEQRAKAGSVLSLCGFEKYEKGSLVEFKISFWTQLNLMLIKLHIGVKAVCSDTCFVSRGVQKCSHVAERVWKAAVFVLCS